MKRFVIFFIAVLAAVVFANAQKITVKHQCTGNTGI